MELPIKMQLFMICFHIWTSIAYYISKCIYWSIGLALKYIPNNMTLINYGPKKYDDRRQKIHLTKVIAGNKQWLNKLNLFINWFWDNDLCDETGGININKLKPFLQSSYIYIVYIFELDDKLPELYHAIINLNTDDASYQHIPDSTEINYPVTPPTRVDKKIMFNQFSFNPEFSFD